MAKIITAMIETEGAEAGVVSIDLAGYKGKGCHAVQEVFTKGLGGKTLVDTKKPEFNAAVTTAVRVTR
jgi:hypothetical protein